MKVLITGGTVFVSRYTAEYFVKRGHSVYVLNRNTRPQSEGVHLINCDRHHLGEVLKDKHFDLVIDATAYNKADIKDLVTHLGSFDDYIFISSSAVYPETLSQPFVEEYSCGANIHWGEYGLGKIAAEKYLKENVPQAYILRPPYLYGPMNNLYREAFVFECAEKGLPFYIPNDGTMPLQFFHIDDMCRFIEILHNKRPVQRVFNVGNPETTDINEWIKICYHVVGKIPEMKYVTNHSNNNFFSFRDYKYVLDVSKQCELMPDIKPLDEGLREAYEWYKDHKDLINRKNYLAYIEKNLC